MISVIIPVYNAEKTIEAALLSVKNQNWEGDFEIIIVDDGSTDSSRSIIETYIQMYNEQNITLINQENSGVSKARNVAMKKATGNFIAFLDADDEWLPEKTGKQMKFLRDEKMEVDFLTSLWNKEKVSFPYQIEARNNLIEITLKKLLFKVTGQTSTAIFKRKVLENTGYFDEDQKYSEDANYWMRVSAKNRMFLLSEHLVIAGGGKKQFGESGLSANLIEMEKGIQKNIGEMYQNHRISLMEYYFFFIFSKFKYWVRPLRSSL